MITSTPAVRHSSAARPSGRNTPLRTPATAPTRRNGTQVASGNEWPLGGRPFSPFQTTSAILLAAVSRQPGCSRDCTADRHYEEAVVNRTLPRGRLAQRRSPARPRRTDRVPQVVERLQTTLRTVSRGNRNVPLSAKLLSPFALLTGGLFSRRRGSSQGRACRLGFADP